jgi:hypothetical protein
MKFLRLFTAIVALSLIAGLGIAGAQTSSYQGTVVDYLTAVGLPHGGVVTYHTGGGGIDVNEHNASIHSFGNTLAARPLALETNGTLYLLDVSNATSNTIADLGKVVGHNVTVKGQTVSKDGANILVVSSVQ